MKRDTLYNIAMFAALIGVLIGSYLTYTHYFEASTVCLPGEEAACDIVLTGPYATLFFGLPNALIGAIGFAMMGFAAYKAKKAKKKDKTAYKWLLGLSTFSILFVLYLAYLIYFVIKAFCAWCFAAWMCVLAIFLCAVMLRKK